MYWVYLCILYGAHSKQIISLSGSSQFIFMMEVRTEILILLGLILVF